MPKLTPQQVEQQRVDRLLCVCGHLPKEHKTTVDCDGLIGSESCTCAGFREPHSDSVYETRTANPVRCQEYVNNPHHESEIVLCYTKLDKKTGECPHVRDHVNLT